MSQLPKSIERLDSLFKIIVGASFAVPGLAGAYGFDVRVVWVAVVFFTVWITLKAFLPGILLLSQERVILDKMKGWSYIIFLAVTFFSNFVMFVILPRTLDVLFIGVAVIGLVLRLALLLVPKRLFKKEIIFMNDRQVKTLYKIFEETGSASIFFSVSILTLSTGFAELKEFSLANVALILVVTFGLFVYAVYRERRSNKLTHDLAIDLLNSGWYKQYSVG